MNSRETENLIIKILKESARHNVSLEETAKAILQHICQKN